MTIEKKFRKPSFGDKLDNFLVRYLAYFNYKNYFKNINFKRDERVLEVGCGEGNLSRFLIKRILRGKLICLDLSKYWINKAKKRLKNFKNIKFIHNDLINYKSNIRFDKIILHFVLHDLIKRELIVKNLNNLLKKGGFVYMREPTRKEHGISSKEIRRLMSQGGFYEKESKVYSCFPIRGEIYECIFEKI